MFSFFLNLNNFSDLDYRMFIRQLQQMLEVGVNGTGGWGGGGGWREGCVIATWGNMFKNALRIRSIWLLFVSSQQAYVFV